MGNELPTSVVPADGDAPWHSLGEAFDAFMRALEAAATPHPDGLRVPDVAGAVCLSGFAQDLFEALVQESDRTLASSIPVKLDPDGTHRLPDGTTFRILHSDCLEGPYKQLPADEIRASELPITPDNAARLAAIDRAMRVVGFPARAWNAHQARRAGGSHQRYNAGDLIPRADLEVLETVGRLLELERKPPRLATEAELRKLVETTPCFDPDDGRWVKNTIAADIEGIKPATLGTYRKHGMATPDKTLGMDRDGRVWRRQGTRNSHPWYLRSTLKSTPK